ncbi:MAG: methyl-accepting chemotaxis protein [Tepidibacter sp.]|jgi:methyl-accepting chemotaxis protein|uniref:methyl-accepting chemotaxis protein n=1 Tax=Tepidibacter sp. TaxID=2529387 RepID=UPI0025D9BAF3|nr:methyl-accepting chemotaxis protein [Tepidibacter sp.]MCT4509425.1 methyl-accepting chemotaxis protein [Tepidibacter sp.]
MKIKLNVSLNSIKTKITAIILIVIMLILTISTYLSIHTIDKSMKNQLKEDGIGLVKEITSQLKQNDMLIDQIDEMLGNRIISVAYTLGGNQDISNEHLKQVAKNTGVSEINVANNNGVIIYSNLIENIGYKYPDTHVVKILLDGNQDKVIEDIRKSEVSGDYYKYGATRLANGGIVQVGIMANDIEEMQKSMNIQAKVDDIAEQDNIVFAVFIDKNLKAVAHSEKDRIGMQLSDEGSRVAIQEGKEYASEIKYKDTIPAYDVLMPVYNDKEQIGAINIGISMQNLHNAIKATMIKAIITAIITFILSTFIIVFSVGKMINPIKKIVEVSKKVSAGDLTEKINIKSKDEIGVLTEGFNDMIDNLSGITNKIQDVTFSVSSFSQELVASTEQAAMVSEQIALSTQDIAEGSEKQSLATNNVLNNIEEVGSSMDYIKNEITNVVSNANETSKLAFQGREKMEDMITQMDVIKESVGYTSNVMTDLDSASKEIGDILEVINNIADQTNLLALNAAIEAARAGESGRGFAVVADEIRKLAEESMKSSDKIKDLIISTQKNTQKASVAINQGAEETRKGEVIVTEVADYLKDILDGFDLTKEKLLTTSENISNSTEKSQEVMKFAREIEGIAIDAVANTEEVAASSQEQSATINEITRSAEELSNMAMELEEVTKQFKLNS